MSLKVVGRPGRADVVAIVTLVQVGPLHELALVVVVDQPDEPPSCRANAVYLASKVTLGVVESVGLDTCFRQ